MSNTANFAHTMDNNTIKFIIKEYTSSLGTYVINIVSRDTLVGVGYLDGKELKRLKESDVVVIDEADAKKKEMYMRLLEHQTNDLVEWRVKLNERFFSKVCETVIKEYHEVNFDKDLSSQILTGRELDSMILNLKFDS